MYADFYNLSEEPFPVTPDPKYLYLSDSHKEALAAIVYGIENRRGFVAIVGEVGTGKTTILRAYLDAADKDELTIIYVFNPEVTFEELVVLIATELGIYSGEHNTAALVSLIHRALIDQYENGKTVVLIIDEAQNTPIATLESLRMLSNIETEQNKLLQIVLVGQPELQSLLQRHELRQLNQRIAVKSTITPLSAADSRRYIDDRLARVTQDNQAVFEGSAVARIVEYADGIPRAINIACDMALINGFGHKARPVTDRIAKEAIASLAASEELKASWWKPVIGAAATVALVGLAFWAGTYWQDDSLATGTQVSASTEQSVDEPSVPKDKVLNSSEERSVIPAETSSNVATQPQLPVEQASEFSREASTKIVGSESTNGSSPGAGAEFATSESSGRLSSEAITEVASSEGSDEASTEVAIDAAAYSEPDSRVESGLGDIGSATIPESRSAELVAANSTVKPIFESEQWKRIRWDERPLPNTGFPLRYTVGRGDMLSQLCVEFYGFASAELYRFVRRNNPGLVDVNNLSVGDTIQLPALNNELQRLRTASIQRKQKLGTVPVRFTP